MCTFLDEKDNRGFPIELIMRILTGYKAPVVLIELAGGFSAWDSSSPRDP